MAERQKTFYGVISFLPLRLLMKKKNIKQQFLIDNGLHRATCYKLKRNENVNCEVIAHLCNMLKCQPKDIIQYYETREQAEQAEQKAIENNLI